MLVWNGGGREPRWSPPGDEIFYRRGDEMLPIDVVTTPELKLGQLKILFKGNFEPTRVGHRNYDVTSDGQRYVMVEAEGDTAVSRQLHIVVNWHDELERIVTEARAR